MHLKGAEIRDFYGITNDMPSGGSRPRFPKPIKIPHYQRPYKWETVHIEKLINDWSSETGDDYFSGSIVTVNNEQAEAHELIDGQQRFTTIFLANFIRFLVSRVALRQAVSETNRIIHLTDVLNSYIEASKFLFINNTVSKSSIEEELDELKSTVTSEFEDMEDEAKYNEAKEKLLGLIGLPGTKVNEGSADYIEAHHEAFVRFCDSRKLSMSYDRSSFGEALFDALKRCCVYLHEHKNPEISFYGRDTISSEHERKYVDSIEVIFNLFSTLCEEKKPFLHAKKMVEKISLFLSEIKLCVVQTGNAEDAYTLFEVLNDRSLALDDLDLIKNQFYKTFVLKNRGLGDPKIDEVLQSLDDQWVDKIFANESQQKRKLITYLAIVFITGSEDVVYNRGDGYRHAIQKYLERLTDYPAEAIIKHFNIFHACKLILDISGAKFRLKELYALQSEFDRSVSNFGKTVMLLMALNQEGVLSGLVNFVLKYIECGFGEDSAIAADFDAHKVESVLKYIVSCEDSSVIQKQAKKVWQLAVLSKSSDRPREFAVSLIKTNFLGSPRCDYRESGDSFSAALVEFREWLNGWRYGSSNFKVKLLFARLIGLSFDESEGTLSGKFFETGVNMEAVGKLQLDHMEARHIDVSNSGNYFDDDERDLYVEGLGNMMPLPSEGNIQKSNKPFSMSLKYYEDAGLSKHYLLISALEIYEANKTDNGVPRKEFFVNRREKLKELFERAAVI